MTFLRIAAIAAGLLSAPTAHAGLVTMVYSGNPFVLVEPPADPFAYPPLSGEVVLDPAVIGRPLLDTTVTFFGVDDPDSPFDDTAGIVSWTLNIPLYSVGGTDVSFTFDGGGNIASWVIDATDGPPDYFSTPSGDQIFGGNGGRYRADPGTWTVTSAAVVPLPPSLLALAAPLVLLAARGARRSAQRSG